MFGLMTNPANIKRVEFRTGEESLGHLGESASIVLGYNKLLKAAGGTLRGVLCELDIHPLVTSRVEAYKLSKEKVGVWSGHKLATFYFGVCFVFAAILGWSIRTSHILSDWDYLQIFAVVTNWLCVIGIVGFQIAGWVYTFDNNKQGWRDLKHWARFSLNGYDGAVPEFILHKALQIKKLSPDAQFYIDQLVVSRERTVIVRKPDPFLVVSLNNKNGDEESYYIEVWNEKEYEFTM